MPNHKTPMGPIDEDRWYRGLSKKDQAQQDKWSEADKVNASANLLKEQRLATAANREHSLGEAAEKIEKGYGSGHDMKMHGEGKPYGG